jgi:hypothetical protein
LPTARDISIPESKGTEKVKNGEKRMDEKRVKKGVMKKS